MLWLCYGLFTPSEGERKSKINYSVHISIHTKVMPNIKLKIESAIPVHFV